MEPDPDLCWQVEEACLNAWPSPRQLLVDGYLLRAAGGPSRRQNSLNPLRGSGAPVPAIAAAQAIYGALGRRTIVRVPTLAGQMDPYLAQRGFTIADETCTLFRALDHRPGAPDPAVAVDALPGSGWLAIRDAITAADPAAAAVFRDTVSALVLPRAFAAVVTGYGIASIAFAVLDRDLMVFESVATPEPLRGRGHARRAVGALLDWGVGQGARAACLQVVATNAPARALYGGLGFRRELYRYHYRIGPDPA